MLFIVSRSGAVVEAAGEELRVRALWERVCTDPVADRGINVRAHFRPLPDNFWTRLIGAHGFHAWFELLDREGEPLDLETKFVWGLYEGRHQDGPRKGEHNGRALVKWMIWEYEEDGGLARWGRIGAYRHGHLDVHLATLDPETFRFVERLVFEDQRIEVGTYGYLIPLLGRLTSVWSCQRYVREFSRDHGGPADLVRRMRRKFRELAESS